MKPTTLLTHLLTTTAASAATLPRALHPTHPRDAPQYRLLHTFSSSAPSSSNAHLLSATNTESTKGGAILTLPSSSSSSNNNTSSARITSVQTTFRIPHAQPPATGPTANNPVGVYAASFWVGIDAAGAAASSSCSGGGAALRAGVDIFWDGTVGGEQTPFAWYQFATAAAAAGQQGQQGSGTGFGQDGFAVAAGDVVRFTLSAGGTGGADGEQVVAVVLAENFGANVSHADVVGRSASGGGGAKPVRSVKQVVTAPAGLCGQQAAWVVEDFPLEGRPDVPVAFANFTSVTFDGAGVALADGSKKG
ncbi:9298333f-4073-4797-940f-b288c56e4412 [Thermothielavioides terrestris]|nr:9298333f-4073-4797-940f-b288c56e4412 [Thermothielavioides terrestris]